MWPQGVGHSLRQNWRHLAPGEVEGAHPPQVARREALHLREGRAQVRGEADNGVAAPALLGLPRDDALPDLEVQADQLAIGRRDRTDPRLANATAEVAEEGGVGGGERGGRGP